MTAQDPYQPYAQPPTSGPTMPSNQSWTQPTHPHSGHPYHAQPGFGPHGMHGYQMHPVQWPPMAVPAPALVDGFYLLQPRLKPIPSGPAIGSLVAGIGGILGALPGLLFGAFSPWTGLTFFLMAALLGVGSLMLAIYAKRQVKQAAGGISGRGTATAGLVLGIVATALAAVTALISAVAV